MPPKINWSEYIDFSENLEVLQEMYDEYGHRGLAAVINVGAEELGLWPVSESAVYQMLRRRNVRFKPRGGSNNPLGVGGWVKK